MRSRSNRAQRFDEGSKPTEGRERLERRWAGRLIEEPRLATLVTSDGARHEPIHRWLPYRQGFSPGLIRLFLKENTTVRRGDPAGRVLDPFSGSGTCVVECARQGVHAIGVEAMSSLVFLAAAKFERAWPPLPELPDVSSWERVAERLELPIHRAALMLAESRRHTAEGRLNRGTKPIAETIVEVAAMIRDDMCHPLALANPSSVGDARHLDSVDDESVAGIVTSPPYLSRYNYTQTNNPLETVYRFWFGRYDTSALRDQVHATPHDGARREGIAPTHEAAAESADALEAAGQENSAKVVRAYFHDLSRVLDECHRVMRPGGGAWFVVGGARIKDVYVPADLVVAESAERSGFKVHSIRAARDLAPSRRKFGKIGHVAPRESVIVINKL